MTLSVRELALKFFEPLPDGTWRDKETGEILIPYHLRKEENINKEKL